MPATGVPTALVVVGRTLVEVDPAAVPVAAVSADVATRAKEIALPVAVSTLEIFVT
jgi:hypothetical protein